MPLKLSGVTLGNITGGPSSINLYELGDVSIVAPATGQYLRFNGGMVNEWENSFLDSDIYKYLITDSKLVGQNGVGISGNIGTSTIYIGLGNITPTSVAATGPVSGSNLSGANTGDQTITLTTDVTGSGTGTFAATLATVNASPQTDQFRKVTVNGKGLTTATSAVSSGDITTALGYTPVNKAGDTMTGFLILNADPSGSLGAATKQYVDTEIAAVASGVNVHAACETSTTTALPACTYNNGSGGVGATLTANANASLNTIGIGGYTTLTVGARVLIKDQVTTLQNGIYTVAVLGTDDPGGSLWQLIRATDFDGSPTAEIQAGDMTYVQEGTLGGTQWIQINVGTGSPGDYIIIGTNPVIFSQFAGSGTYVAGSGINIATNTISNTGVLSNVAGTGISVSSGTGNVTVTNTGVTSAVAGTNIAVSAATGAVTFSLTGTVPLAANIAGGAVNQIPFQAATNTTTFNAGLTYTPGTNTLSVGTAAAGIVSAATGQTLQISSDVSVTISTNGSSRLSIGSTGAFTIGGGTGTAGQVLISNGGSSPPAWSSTPTITGTNFTSIPNSALTNSSLTIGSTNIALGATALTLAGLTSVTSGSFIPSSATVPTNGLYLSAANTVALATNTTARLSINSTGAATFSSSVDAVSFNATSTKRVKKAIKNISKTYLDKFADLKPREYDRKDYTAHEFGFIAEEMVLVYPEVVGKDEKGRATGIDYGKLSTILTAKVQEQQNVINELQDQVAKIMELLKGSK